MAPGTAVQVSAFWNRPGVTVNVVAADGPPAQPVLTGVGVAQAMPWRLKAANRAVMCGVPSVTLPLSSSAASHCM